SACPGTGNGVFDDVKIFFFSDVAIAKLPERFEYGYHIQFFATEQTGGNSSSVYQNRRTIEPDHRHHRTGHIFIATHYGYDCIVILSGANSFDRIGDDLATRQRKAHPIRPHGNSVTDSDRSEERRVGKESRRSG